MRMKDEDMGKDVGQDVRCGSNGSGTGAVGGRFEESSRSEAPLAKCIEPWRILAPILHTLQTKPNPVLLPIPPVCF
jgi:hypothetical protein